MEFSTKVQHRRRQFVSLLSLFSFYYSTLKGVVGGASETAANFYYGTSHTTVLFNSIQAYRHNDTIRSIVGCQKEQCRSTDIVRLPFEQGYVIQCVSYVEIKVTTDGQSANLGVWLPSGTLAGV
jgi:hypothetical protein